MYNWEKSLREEKLRRNARNPSFSSTLLDEIYRSIDGGLEKREEFKINRERAAKKQSNNGVALKSNTNNVEDEETASLRRACLIEKLMEKKVSEKASARRRQTLPPAPEVDRKSPHDNDPLFFSSSSSSSDSSFGGFSSSETESFPATKLRTSCFRLAMLKPVKTSSSEKLSDDRRNDEEEAKCEEGSNNLKLRALKIYSNLKKAKQPISPGGRLSSFLNSLFTNGNAKSKTNSPRSIGVHDEAKATAASTCSSASSYSRSCLSKNSLTPRDKFNNGAKRTVRFNPVSVIVDEDSRPCGKKYIYRNENFENHARSQLRSNEIETDFSKCYQNQKKNEFVLRNGNANDDRDDDVLSDSSSDLFEIDHLGMMGKNRYCEELPVYETTHLHTNRAISNGFVR